LVGLKDHLTAALNGLVMVAQIKSDARQLRHNLRRNRPGPMGNSRILAPRLKRAGSNAGQACEGNGQTALPLRWGKRSIRSACSNPPARQHI
jgi:hypothetical protein